MTKSIDQRIVELVQSYWDNYSRVMKLTTLGKALGKEFDVSKELMGAKLKPYLQARLSQSLLLVVHPSDPLTWGVIPKSVAWPDEAEKRSLLFESSPNFQPSAHVTGKKVFDKVLWAAFSVPLKDAEKRVVKLGQPIEFKSILQHAPIPDGWLEISREKIIPSDANQPDDRSAQLVDNITSWAKNNEVDLDNFVMKRTEHRHRSLLDMLVGALDDEGLKEIKLSLKTVKVLLEKHA